MSVVWVHGVSPSWFSDFITKAKPAWASAHVFSMTLPSMSMRRACLDSIRFFDLPHALPRRRPHDVVAADGDVGRRDVLHVMPPPPNMITSWPASRWLFWMRKGPGPFQPTIACESQSLLWQSPSHESTTAVVPLLSMHASLELARGISVDVGAIEDRDSWRWWPHCSESLYTSPNRTSAFMSVTGGDVPNLDAGEAVMVGAERPW